MPELYWSYSYYELVKKVDLKYGLLVATQLAQHNGLVQVVNAALGGDAPSAEPPKGAQEISYGDNVESAVMNINSLLRIG